LVYSLYHVFALAHKFFCTARHIAVSPRALTAAGGPAGGGMNREFARSLPAAWDQYARFFFALGDPCRQKILLIFETGEELCVNEIASLFDLSRPAISHHLKVLREAQLLSSEKRGKEVYYRVNYVFCASVLRAVHEFAFASARVSAGPRTGGDGSLRAAADGA